MPQRIAWFTVLLEPNRWYRANSFWVGYKLYWGYEDKLPTMSKSLVARQKSRFDGNFHRSSLALGSCLCLCWSVGLAQPEKNEQYCKVIANYINYYSISKICIEQPCAIQKFWNPAWSFLILSYKAEANTPHPNLEGLRKLLEAIGDLHITEMVFDLHDGSQIPYWSEDHAIVFRTYGLEPTSLITLSIIKRKFMWLISHREVQNLHVN